MSSRSERIYEDKAGSETIPTIIATSYFVVKRGAAADEAIVPSAATDALLGRLNAKTTVAGEIGSVQPFIPGQKMLLVTDGSIDAIGDRVVLDTVTPGRVKKLTPTFEQYVIGRAAEVDGAAGTLVLVDITNEGPYAAS